MMRLTYGLAVLAAVSALTTVSANAQLPAGSAQLTIKGGVYNPSKDPAKRVGKNWWVGGLEYSFGDVNAPTVNSVEALYSSKDGDVTEIEKLTVPSKYTDLSLMLNHKIRSLGKDGVALGNVVFYGGGVGVHIIKVNVDDKNPGGDGTFNKRRTVAGANLFVGYDMAANFQIEAKYQFVFSKVDNRDMSGLQFLVGVKF